MIAFLTVIMTLGLLSLALLAFAFWLWMLIDCATNEPAEGNDKIIWILILIFTHLVGALIYCFVRRPQRRRDVGR